MKSRGVLLAILMSVSPVFADILTVPDMYSTIQEAIDAANEGDTVIVSPGIYSEHIDMAGKAIMLMSTDPNDLQVVAQTIIDGGGSGSVIVCDSRETSDTVIAGFWIQNGYAGTGNAGGIYCQNSDPIIKNCVFSGNTAGNFGGGVFCWSGAPTVLRCTFLGNFSANYGGGIGCYQSDTAVVNCVFSGNDATRGGAIAFYQCSNPTVMNCTLSGNTTKSGGFGGYGGAVYSNLSNPTVANSILWGNFATHDNEINISGGSPTVNYSVVEGGWAGSGQNNTSEDPLFMDADGADDIAGTADDDLHLDPFSICINAR